VKDCANEQFLSRQDCIDASDTGATIGIGLIFVFGAIGFIVLSLVWFMTKPKEQS